MGRCWFFFILMTLTAALPAGATELFEYQRPLKAMGMGGVYLPFVSDTHSVLWNPARLADVDSLEWEIMALNAGINGDQGTIDAIRAMGSCSGPTCYDDLYGKPIWVGYGGQTTFAAPKFGFAAFNYGSFQGVLHNPAYPSFNLSLLNDYGFAGGFGMNLLPGMSVGATFKRINRMGGSQDVGLDLISSGDTNAIINSFSNRGTGYGMDLGMDFRIPGPFQTILAVHWQDVGSTAFIVTDGGSAPPRIKDNLSVGIGTLLDLPGLDWSTGIEYRQITTQGEQLGKKLHIGTELSLPFIDLRAGLNQGYPTIGAGLDLFFLKFDAASYIEETGVYPGQTPSQRYQFSLSMNLSIDANFKFTTTDGKRRNLKQRR